MSHIDNFLERITDTTELDELWGKLEQKHSIIDYKLKKDENTELAIIADYTEAAKERLKQWGKLQGISTGYDSLDKLTGGLCPGELVIVAGQTSHGKSQLAANIAYNVASRGEPVLFVSLEMTKPETTSRFMRIYEHEHPGDSDGVASLPIMYQSQNELEYSDISLLMWKAKENGAKLVIIDHLHYFPRGTGDNIRNEIGRITKHFKECAIKHDLPVLLLSHVRRLSDPKQKPQLSDLKESGYIEQDADIVLMVWRDLSEVSVTTDLVDVSILKNRNRGFPNFRVAELIVPAGNGVKLIERSRGINPITNPFSR